MTEDARTVSDMLAGLSQQVRAVALAVSCAPEGGSFSRGALLGASDILERVASALDDLAELPLPSLEELGEEADLIRIAELRLRNRRVEDLLCRIRQLGRFQHTDLSRSLREAVRKMTAVEGGFSGLVIEGGDKDLAGKIQALEATSREASLTLQACLGDLRRLNDQVSRIVPLVDELQRDST